MRRSHHSTTTISLARSNQPASGGGVDHPWPRSRSSFPTHDAYGRLLHPLHPLRGWLFRAHGPGALLELPRRERGQRRPSGRAPPGRAWAHADGLGDVRRRVSVRASPPLARSRARVLTPRRSCLSSLRAHSAFASDLHHVSLVLAHNRLLSRLHRKPPSHRRGCRPPCLGMRGKETPLGAPRAMSSAIQGARMDAVKHRPAGRLRSAIGSVDALEQGRSHEARCAAKWVYVSSEEIVEEVLHLFDRRLWLRRRVRRERRRHLNGGCW
jgi:hypothetical protein